MFRSLLPRFATRTGFVRTFATTLRDRQSLNGATSDALAKYREKLQLKAEREGFKSIEDMLLAKPKQSAASKDVPPVVSTNAAPSIPPTQPQSTVKKPSARKDGLPSYVKPLAEIVNYELLSSESSDNIDRIWNEFHSSKAGMVSGVMSSTFYSSLKKKGKEFPMFILPLPREGGAEFYMLQFSYNQIYYTTLLEYKTHLTEARPCLILTHYEDFASDKNIVLMRGEISKEGGILKADDARLLVLLTQLFYVTGNDNKKKLVETFNKKPQEFQYQSLLQEMEKMD